MESITITRVPREQQHSDYDWFNIQKTFGDTNERIGKVRCHVRDNTLTIYSINIFEEYSGNGYGQYFINYAKQHYDQIIADRVRYSAAGFWEKMGFAPLPDGNYQYPVP